jgi:hypothetical protein
MRAWLYNRLVTATSLHSTLGGPEGIRDRVVPRFASETINLPKPFLVFGLGNATNEDLAEDTDHEAYRQFFQIWVHDEPASFLRIDNELIVPIKKLLTGASDKQASITTIRWLETSQEFNNETYNTIFRYIRFQAIISKGERVQA